MPRDERVYDENKMMRDDTPPSHDEQKRAKWKSTKLSGFEKDKLHKRAKELESRIAEGMPTHGQMWKPTEENVEANRRWQKENQGRISEYKEIRKRLEPDNPNAGRVEHLRRQGEADKLARWI